jgi:NosR/NirI family nitrous oxide reductase transcriptional regulator
MFRFALAGLLQVAALCAMAEGIQDHAALVKRYFPEMTTLGELSGNPPAAEVRQHDKLIGYVYYTDDAIKIPAYSGKPIRTLVGFDLEGKIRGVTIVHHEEPILLVGITNDDLQKFINQYVDKNIFGKIKIGGRDRDGYKAIDTISGATITVMVLNATINRSLQMILESRRITPQSLGVTAPKLGNSLAGAEPTNQPVWIYVWKERLFQIVVLSLGLLILMLILIFQDWLVQHPKLLSRVRTGFLIWTVVFIGWYTLAQLSVVNVLTFVGAIVHGFSWDSFLIDPMLFLLWGFVAMTLLLWGRGVYCGWLCPFGALQELLFRLGQRFGIRSYEFPDSVHQRLWAVKYLMLLALFGISLQSLATAERMAEVEPFKTAFALHFMRDWGFVLYAAGLLVIGLFVRKFYCRYVCALGAALTYPARFRIFDWLLRRKECGRPCQICAEECEVQAIRPTGEINPNECHYCLDCQVTFFNDHKCPPVVEKRRKRERFSPAQTGKTAPVMTAPVMVEPPAPAAKK